MQLKQIKIRKSYKYTKTKWYEYSKFTLIGISVIFISLLSPFYSDYFREIFFLGPIIGFSILIGGNNWLTQKRKQIESKLGKMIEKLYKEIDKKDNVEIILKKTSITYDEINKIIRYKNFIDYFYTDTVNTAINKTFQENLKLINAILTDLRSDLSIRIAEQQKILESTKGEVEKNIKGSSELNQVSELQKARLDRQIEQFEELQRVLVKV